MTKLTHHSSEDDAMTEDRPSNSRLTLLNVFIVLAFCVFGIALGALLLGSVMENLQHKEMFLRPRRAPRRLLTYTANPVEFVLRILFMASLGGFFFSAGVLLALGFMERLIVLRLNFFAGPFRTALPKALLLVPAILFGIWMVLFAILPFFS